jgi:adenine phosphoribosyltransferase
MDLKKLVKDIPDFPIPGVLFRDISPILENHEAFSLALEKMFEGIDLKSIQHFVGVESRGFILGAALAHKYKKGFVPLRKAGKLPPPVEKLSYTLEYGTASLEIRPGQGNVLIVDDVLATGGTLQASIDLCKRAGYNVIAVSVLIDLPFLNKMTFNGEKIPSVISY